MTYLMIYIRIYPYSQMTPRAKNIKLWTLCMLKNPIMPGIVKIGMTTRFNVNAWIKELYSTVVHSQESRRF